MEFFKKIYYENKNEVIDDSTQRLMPNNLIARISDVHQYIFYMYIYVNSFIKQIYLTFQNKTKALKISQTQRIKIKTNIIN